MEGVVKYWQQLVFVVVLTIGIGRTWSEFEQQKLQIEGLQKQIDENNSVLHRRLSATDSNIDILVSNINKNTIEIYYLKGKIEAHDINQDANCTTCNSD